ncbi:MAG: hypothetical protein HWN67_19475 [Candidatus Helarchaeota archaeon]|nr:hypothetical protein [Candidatus Helarchaeota archaeon]
MTESEETESEEISGVIKAIDDLKNIANFFDEFKDDYVKISRELQKMSKDFQGMAKIKGEKIKLREVLALSMTLLTEVFGAQPHSKILFLLHGVEEMTRDALTKASGISPAAIRHALADLNAAKLVEYDVEKETGKLLKRIY